MAGDKFIESLRKFIVPDTMKENHVRLTVSGVNYAMYASTAVDTDKITDAIALASATKAFKEDKASQYQKSLDFLEAMVSAAEFRDISEDWLK